MMYRLSDIYKYTHGYISYVRYGRKEVKIMGYGCCSTSYKGGRSFLTREERVQLLKEYKQDLERETKGVEERIRELEG
jgi:hypothetical protein